MRPSACRLVLGLCVLLFLAACVNDTPYSDNYAHINVDVNGPGFVAMSTEVHGPLLCTAHEGCGYVNELQAQEVITILVIPDGGHEFTGWTSRAGSSWIPELTEGASPLQLPADGDYFLIANFR